MKNRTLKSYIYNGWKVKAAIKNAVSTPDVVLREEEKFIKSNNLLDDRKEKYYYLYSFEGSYKVKLTEEEANYYKKLNQ